MSAVTHRMTAEERREHLVQAAVHEFAQHGYHAASTTSIARRAGISQPYVYALFPNKKELFVAVNEHVGETIRAAFREAAQGAEGPDDALARMGEAFHGLLERDELLCQLQGYAAAGDPEIREPVARCFAAVFDEVRRLSGAPPERVAQFIATGMLLTITGALQLDLDGPG